MKYLKNIGISLAYILGILATATLILSTLSYFNWLNGSVLSIFKLLIAVSSLLVGGIMIGKVSKQKGWLEGLKLSLIFLVILTLFNYLGLKHSFQLKDLLYYLILTVSGMVGSMIGINHKKNASSN